MKKLLLRNYVYYFLLILSISLIFQSCTDNNNIEVQEQKKNNLVVESVSFSEIEDNAAINKVFLNHGSKSRINKSSDTSKESESYEILINEISKASYKDYEAYTFRIDNPDQPPFTFDNYVIRKKHDGTVEEFILRYTYDKKLLIQDNFRTFATIEKYDTDYHLLSSSNDKLNGSDQIATKQSASGNCTVTVKVFHTIPDGREYEFVEGSVCQHPGECNVVIEYNITCRSGGGGGGPTTGGQEGSPGSQNPDLDGPGGGGSTPPDNGGPSEPITTMEPPLGQEGTTNTLEQLQNIIEEPLPLVAAQGQIDTKASAFIAYLSKVNSTVFKDLNAVEINNLYDSSLSTSDKIVLWEKSKAIYDIIKANNPSSPTSFNSFFSRLDQQEKESYTKNSLESALFSSVKSITNYWPQNEQEWGVLFKMMSPMLLEMGIEFLPFGGVFNAGKDTLAGLAEGDYTTAVIGVVGLIMEFVPWAKVAKVASKVYDVGKSVFKMFKLAYNFMGSFVAAIERGLKTVLDGSIVKLYDNAGLQVGKITDNVFEVTKHGIKTVDGSVVFRSADDVNAELALLNYTDPPFIML